MTTYLLPRPRAHAPRSTLAARAAVAGLIVLLLHLAGLFALDWLSSQALPTSNPVPITSSETSIVVKSKGEGVTIP